MRQIQSQEMTLDEYEKMMEEKRANLNKPAANKAAPADPNAFEGMKAYSRKVCTFGFLQWCAHANV